ncbi:MAG: ABC transporter permease [Lactococcus petauri]
MIENILLSLESIWNHKLRSILTMIGIVIGISSIVMIFSIVEGNTENTKKSMLGGENNSMSLKFDTEANLNGAIGETGEKPDYLEVFSEKERQMMKNIPLVKDATFSYEAEGQFLAGEKETDGKIIGITDNYFEYENYFLLKGRLLTSADYTGETPAIVLDKALYESLFKDKNGLGHLVEIKGTPYKVVGVVEQKKSTTPGIYSLDEKTNKAFTSVLNWSKFMETWNPIPVVKVKTEKADDLQPTAQAVADCLNKEIPKSDYIFGIYNSKEMEKRIDEYAHSQFQLLGGIASISLIVGGIGVMNIMLVSVTERTREIGIKKALGARRRFILEQFLLEAIMLTVVGGVIGIILGIIGAKIIAISWGHPYYISWLSIIGSLLFSMIIGLVFGLLPAMQASKLDPIEALRYE